MVRFLTLAIAALLTANGVILAEQASGRDLITLSRDGVDNAREAIAKLLDDSPETKVAGEVLEKTTTTTGPAETTTTTGAPAAVTPPPVETPTSGPAATAPPATTPTTAKKAGKGGTDWAHVADTVRPYIEKETSLPFKGAVSVVAMDTGAFTGRLNSVRLNPAMERARRNEGTLKALGIIEPGVNLAEQVKRLSTGSVTAFYDVKGNELVVREGNLTPFVLKTIVHELVRAVYDQHFELDRPELANPDDETGAAWDSLIEGAAARIEARFISALPDKDKQSVQAEQQRLANQLPKDLPDYVLVQYAFPFGAGPKFAEALMGNGGAGRINGAFQAPPRTTEQIIHPERFVAGEGPKPLADPAADGPIVRSGSIGQLMLTAHAGPGARRGRRRERRRRVGRRPLRGLAERRPDLRPARHHDGHPGEDGRDGPGAGRLGAEHAGSHGGGPRAVHRDPLRLASCWRGASRGPSAGRGGRPGSRSPNVS